MNYPVFLPRYLKTMKRIAVFPGSFDPITQGHVSIVKRAVQLFDEIIVAVGVNADKKAMFPVEVRKQWIETVFKDMPQISVELYQGLTIDFCQKAGANYILRGLRTAADFEFERGIGQVNKLLATDVETVFLLTEAKYTPISSSIVRDVIRHQGDVNELVPKEILSELKLFQSNTVVSK